MHTTTPLKPRLHPLLATAAIAVTAFSVAGLAALSGLLPMSRAATSAAAQPAAAVVPAPTFAATPPRSVARPATAAPRPAPRQVSHTESLPVQAAPQPPAICANCGTIESVREAASPGEANGLGAIVGGLLGGIVGNQIGKGGGNTVATVLGAAGGAYAGHQFEKSRNQALRYEIGVRMHDGSLRNFTEERMPSWRIGERVRVEHGTLLHDSGADQPRQAI